MLDLQYYCCIVVARITETKQQTQTKTYKYTCLHKVSVVFFKSAISQTGFDQTICLFA